MAECFNANVTKALDICAPFKTILIENICNILLLKTIFFKNDLQQIKAEKIENFTMKKELKKQQTKRKFGK